MQLKKTIVLVGVMGCGKSAIGLRLAQELEVPFIDLDTEIEKNEGLTITEIFDKHGESYFREIEKEAINKILNSKICILASGGGTFINDETRSLIKKIATSVYIRADFDIILERVSRKDTRPLLEQGDKATILKNLMEKRCPIYEQADITVDSSNGIHETVVNSIIEALG